MLSYISFCNLGPALSACFMGSSTFVYLLNSRNVLCSKSCSFPTLQFSLGNLTQSSGFSFYPHLVIHNSLFLVQPQDFISKTSSAQCMFHFLNVFWVQWIEHAHNGDHLLSSPATLVIFLVASSFSINGTSINWRLQTRKRSIILDFFPFLHQLPLHSFPPLRHYVPKSNQSYFSCKYARFFSFLLALRNYA